MRPFRPLLFVLAVFVGGGLSALETGPRFRADDGNLWRMGANPALTASAPGGFDLGFGASPDGDRWDQGARLLSLHSPILSFDYGWKGGDSDLRFATALGPWNGLSLGFDQTSLTRGSTSSSAYGFGLVYRPFDLVSAGLTVDDAFGPQRLWGAGLALRPLAAFGPPGDLLTLTGDATWTGTTVSWDRAGARLVWAGADLRTWYDFTTRAPGFEVSLTLGASETTLSPTFAGQALRWSPRTTSVMPWGSTVLRLRNLGTLSAAPPVSTPLARFAGVGPSASLPDLVALLDRAARDPSVAAVAFEEPPTVGGLASAADLAAALDRLHRAGKKVWVHAEGYGDSPGFQGWVASADRISLAPTGTLVLTAGAARRFYFKEFFDKIGVEFVNFAPWETKSANNGLTFAAMPEAERAMLTRFLTDRQALATSALAAGRGDRLKATAASVVAGGPYLAARTALEAGLVDVLESRTAFEDELRRAFPGTTLVEALGPGPAPGWGPSATRRTVAVVHLVGDIVPGPGEAGRSIGRAAAETLAALRTDASVAAILLRVDSPGGAVTPSDVLADEVRATVAAGKPVVVAMGDLAASGGYYLAAPASRIFAQPGTLTGSIGVTAAWFTAPQALKTLGIRSDGVDLAPSSGFGDWTRPLPEADRQKWSQLIEATYDRFLDVVAAGRKLDKAKVEPLARGQIYTGREALALGLVDELGGQTEAQAWLEATLGDPVVFRDYVPGTVNAWGGLLGPLASAALAASDSPTLKAAAALDPWTAPWAEALAGLAARGPGPLVWVDAP